MAIGETILGAVIQVVIEKLMSQEVINFLHRSKIDPYIVEKLKTKMLSIEKLILDAEEKQMSDLAVKQWLHELKHWFYRAEEIIDDVTTKARQSSPLSFMTKVCNLLCSICNSSSDAKTITLNIREIVSMFESMLSQQDALGLREPTIGKVPQRVPTTSLFEDSQVYGRGEERDKIIEFLLSEENTIGVIAILGMGGIGKTTLAKLLFNDERLKEVFDLKVWVCVSDQLDIPQVTRSILESVAHQPYSTSLDLNFLQNDLSGKLREKRFLLVLDDVWQENYEEWQHLHAPFSAGRTGSKIIVTTRKEGVARIISTASSCYLKPLSDDDSWSLFSRHAFEVGSSVPDHNLEFIGKKIVDKCRGLPLAIKTLAGLLRGTRDVREWEVVLHSRLWELPKERTNVIPALWLSYHYLPPNLKRCFSYCAIFPKDYKIDRKKLVLLWMAEDFLLSSESGKSIEDTGDEYVQQLVSMSFLEPTDKSYVTMHDVMHDLAEFISGDFIARQEHRKPSGFSERARHFSFYAGFYDRESKFEAIHKTQFLRTSLQLRESNGKRYFLAQRVTTALIPHFHYLRVLCLLEYEIFRLPESIGCLKQLRYLDVSHTKIAELPESLSSLQNLQSLLLADCCYLKMLPADIGKLTLLRHLDTKGTTSLLEMPKHMSKLTNLQTLTSFVVGKTSGSGIKDLRELQHIHGEFALRRLQHVADPNDALNANLSERKSINILALEFDYEEDKDSEKAKQVQLLENLEPSTNIEDLAITNFFGRRFPKWLDPGCAKYTKLTSLHLSGCLNCHSLPPLGQLPTLTQLDIEGMNQIAIVGDEFYGHNNSSPFQALEGLSFKNMRAWEVWSNVDAKGNAMFFPLLQRLSLCDCPKLKGGLPIHAPLLEEVEIERCGQLSRLLSQREFRHDTLEVASPLRVEFRSEFDWTMIRTLRLDSLAQLVQIPEELCRLSELQELRIASCENLKSLANAKLPPQLELLKIEQCEVLECLPDGLAFLHHLESIELNQCPRLSWVPRDVLPTSLGKLEVQNCRRLNFPIPEERMWKYTSLGKLVLRNTSNDLVLFPLGIFPNLAILYLCDCTNLEKVLTRDSLTSLKILHILSCPKLEMIGKPTGRGEATILSAPNLECLAILDCDNVKAAHITTQGEVLVPKLQRLGVEDPSKWIPWRSLPRFSQLRCLRIRGLQVERFPSDEDLGSVPTSLTALFIRDFSKLRELDGRALQSLTSLQELSIRDCPELECLPKEELPPSLGVLHIKGCPKLEERLKRKKGRDWSTIKHLPCVVINDLLFIPRTHGRSVPYGPQEFGSARDWARQIDIIEKVEKNYGQVTR